MKVGKIIWGFVYEIWNYTLYGVTPMADSGFYTKIMPKNAQKNEHISKTA